ncbi:GNAT family N-acetyltransferase [Microbacterium sp. ASV49]|uniref:GNAT family N-acetyltransferase n=1 Tax=Microbacterium candidum TaxID=3041922 RepID=A0ABT7N024_9MICO|nr:GNAT family N-acetyltransferase [Microbacterium sp. ASV49]MDL9980010.1 GNAT family N-acetyltransferase [Microbacterium sp. ASV49]
MTTTMTFGITRLPIPASLDAPEAKDLREWVRVANLTTRHDAGHGDLDYTAAELFGAWSADADWLNIPLMVRAGDTTAGVAVLSIATQPGTVTAEADFQVLPEYRGSGAEEVLMAAVEDAAREHGRTKIHIFTVHRPVSSGDEIRPPSGWGSVPADDPQTRCMLRNGFALGQVERNSVFDLQADPAPVQRAFDDAVAFAGPDYRYVEWTSPTPPEYRDGYAYALSRMATDVPAGSLEIEEQDWDAARIERRDARQRAQRLRVSVAAVVHVPTGRIVAYNELVIGDDDPTAATAQYGTLVVKEHRGHRLGTIVKTGNILRWREVTPESPRISTFNAEENRPMLDINEAIGFVPVSCAGAWEKAL